MLWGTAGLSWCSLWSSSLVKLHGFTGLLSNGPLRCIASQVQFALFFPPLNVVFVHWHLCRPLRGYWGWIHICKAHQGIWPLIMSKIFHGHGIHPVRRGHNTCYPAAESSKGVKALHPSFSHTYVFHNFIQLLSHCISLAMLGAVTTVAMAKTAVLISSALDCYNKAFSSSCLRKRLWVFT